MTLTDEDANSILNNDDHREIPAPPVSIVIFGGENFLNEFCSFCDETLIGLMRICNDTA